MNRVTGVPGSWQLAFGSPDARLRNAVRTYQGYWIGPAAGLGCLSVPDGSVSLIAGIEGKVALGGVAYESPLSGPRTNAIGGEPYGSVAGVRITLTPWATYRLFGVPMRELVNTVVELADVSATLERQLLDRLRTSTTSSWTERFAVVDDVLADAYARGPVCAPEVVRAWRELSRTAGQVSVSTLADRVGWCERHLESKFREQIGLTPKAAARVLRLRKALRSLAAGKPSTEVALTCGYYDQAHLCREFRAMTGLPPARLARELAAQQAFSYGELGFRLQTPWPSRT